jgi:hypothetical protein
MSFEASSSQSAEGKMKMVYLIVILSILARFIPHVSNFSPVYGALLLGGAHLKKRESVWFPVLLLGASDIVLTHFVYHLNVGWTEVIQMAAFASIAMTGWTLRRRFTFLRFGVACVAGPSAFYLISNFGVWLGFHHYPLTWKGLVACYVAGIPYYGRSLASTILFAAILFGSQHLHAARMDGRRHSDAIAR